MRKNTKPMPIRLFCHMNKKLIFPIPKKVLHSDAVNREHTLPFGRVSHKCPLHQIVGKGKRVGRCNALFSITLTLALSRPGRGYKGFYDTLRRGRGYIDFCDTHFGMQGGSR